jgi:hypothetical protein
LSRTAGLAAAALVSGGLLAAQPLGIGSVHWKSKTEMTGGQQGDMTTESEMWTKDKKLRMKTSVMGMNMNVVKSGDVLYQWQEGQTTGMRIPHGGGQSMSYVNKVDEVRSKGKKIGNEKVDGHSCEIFEFSASDQEHGGIGKHTYWLAKDLKNFPVKIVMETGGMKRTILNHEVDLSDTIPDSFLIPPKGVKFQDNPR